MSYTSTIKEFRLLTNDLQDFSNIDWGSVNVALIQCLEVKERTEWFKSKIIQEGMSDSPNLILPMLTYVDMKTKIYLSCPIHDKYYQLPRHFLEGHGCPKCSKFTSGLGLEQFIKEAILIHGDKYDYSKVVYVNNTTKVEIICRKHNKPFWQEPKYHLRDSGCPICSSSKGELLISKILQNNRLKFETQWHFNKHQDLRKTKYSAYLRFDFYLPDYNLCIEYDGRQHYDVDCMGQYINTKEKFEDTQRSDQFKNQFCLDNSIRLLRIPYWVNPTKELILSYLNEDFTIINASTRRIKWSKNCAY